MDRENASRSQAMGPSYPCRGVSEAIVPGGEGRTQEQCEGAPKGVMIVPDRIDRRSFLSKSMAAAGGVAAAGVAGGALSACGSGSGGGATGGARNGISTATPQKGGSLQFGVEAEEQGFDPATGRFDETGVQYARTVFDPLTILATDGSVQPYLAQAITPNSDYTVWTITARPNVRFHDGTTCDAAAIAGSLNHFKDNLLGVTFTAVSNIAATSE